VRSRGARLGALLAAVASLVLALVLAGEDPEPYVVTAIDYHFHDAHPTLPIGRGRDLVVSNQGRNLHNVTIPALDLSEDVTPGERFAIRDVASRLAPGAYPLVCLLHQDRGMTGTIVIAAE
jgi:plastocyanin